MSAQERRVLAEEGPGEEGPSRRGFWEKRVLTEGSLGRGGF